MGILYSMFRLTRPLALRWSAPAFLLIALGGLSSCAVSPPASPPEPVRLRVIAFNDFHGYLEESGQRLLVPDPTQPERGVWVPTGGAAHLAGLVQSLRQGQTHSLVVSSGDLFGGTPLVSALFKHEPTVQASNLMGVDVAIPGNHEFDAGTDELLRLIRGGCAPNRAGDPLQSCAVRSHEGFKYPVIASNIDRVDGRPLFPSTWIRQVGPVKVGFIGAITMSTPSLVVPTGVAGLRFSDEADRINRAAAELKAQGVKALVAVIHEGIDSGPPGEFRNWNDPDCSRSTGAGRLIAERLSSDVALVLQAHTHQGYNCRFSTPAGPRAVMQAVSFGRGVSVADLVIDPRTGEIDRVATRTRNLPVLNPATPAPLREALLAATPEPWREPLRGAQPAPDVERLVQAYATAAAPQAQRKVGTIQGSFSNALGRVQSDTSMGRLIADAQWAATRDPARGGAELALMNQGGVRASLNCRTEPPCAVTYGEVFSTQPFGNSLIVMTLTGAELKSMLEQQARPDGGASIVSPSSSLRFTWVSGAPAGQRVRDLELNGTLVRPEQSIRVAVNSFMADGGDGFTVLKTGRDRLGGPQDLDALVAYLQLNPAPDPVTRVQVRP